MSSGDTPEMTKALAAMRQIPEDVPGQWYQWRGHWKVHEFKRREGVRIQRTIQDLSALLHHHTLELTWKPGEELPRFVLKAATRYSRERFRDDELDRWIYSHTPFRVLVGKPGKSRRWDAPDWARCWPYSSAS